MGGGEKAEIIDTDYFIDNEANVEDIHKELLKVKKKINEDSKNEAVEVSFDTDNKENLEIGIEANELEVIKKIAISFDDGPHPKITPKILEEFHKRGAKATFYVVGDRVERYPSIAYQIIKEGHEIGNHTWDHPYLTKLKVKDIQQQLVATQEIIFRATGKNAISMRPPYGALNNRVREAIDMPIILWNIDVKDWMYRDSDYISSYIIKHAYDGAIILLHDIYPSTAEAIGSILDDLIGRGFQLVTVSQLLGMEEEIIEETVIYKDLPQQRLISF
ncbi:polysaccharide deacetylase family protein [Alkaliphilus serpentinus]|uniref:Polysaccharide deacetylase family protein n=1 Tax=Alkaliphilus serpentinus TaxID=1482731 RepID=A0A833HR44_9FIRM|nr:polysaccharide deacetylase family protein [Alkaliphilus serpentinus]KAB3532834.1 polysaccharide deacetylase family protein [Alkaliphilus serpentinus]